MKTPRIFLASLVVFTLLASCSLRPSQLLNGQSTPTFPLIDINTPTFAKEPSITPVSSPTRRATFPPFLTSTRGPSITPFPSFTPIPDDLLARIQADVTKSRFLTGGNGAFQCKLLSTEPEELEVLRPKEEFTGIWRIQNKGKAQWTTEDMAYFYISGWRFQTQKYKEDFIPYVVNPKEELHLHVPMRAPAEEGVYFTIWGLRIKSIKQFFCTFALSIIVQVKK